MNIQQYQLQSSVNRQQQGPHPSGNRMLDDYRLGKFGKDFPINRFIDPVTGQPPRHQTAYQMPSQPFQFQGPGAWAQQYQQQRRRRFISGRPGATMPSPQPQPAAPPSPWEYQLPQPQQPPQRSPMVLY